MVFMARSSQVALVEEVALISAVLDDVDLCRHIMVDVGAWRVAAAQDPDLAQGIPR
jgi:hypothetical protein